MKKIFVALSSFGSYQPDPFEEFKKNGYEIIFNPLGRKLTEQEVIEHARGSDGILAGLEPLNEKVLRELSNLKVISRSGIGVDNIDLDVAKKKDIKVYITPEAPISSVVELTLALTLNLLRRVSQADRLIRQKKWTRLKGEQLGGKTVGIVGLGRIGKRVATVFQALGAHVVATDPVPDFKWAEQNNVTLLSFHDLLNQSHVVSLHTPKLTEGHYLIGKDEFGKLRDGSFLINVARGGVVDEKALINALQTKKIAGAGLDVFESEPYEGPLTEFDNILLTAHMGSHTVSARARMEQEAAKNLVEGLLSQQ